MTTNTVYASNRDALIHGQHGTNSEESQKNIDFKEQLKRWWLVTMLGLVVALLLAARFAAKPNQGFKDGAAVLAMVGVVAVGIERMIEMLWSLVGTLKSGWWPLTNIAQAVDGLVKDIDGAVQPAFDHARERLEALKAAAGTTAERIKEIDHELETLRQQEGRYVAQIRQVGALGMDNQRVQLIATTAIQAVNRLDTAYGAVSPGVRKAFNDASQVATGACDIVAGFGQNPAKKILSILLGVVFGLSIASFVGLDLFAAAGAPIDGGRLFPCIGVAITGLVLGLGASPTHNVINYVTQVAASRKAEGLGQPVVPETVGQSVVDALAAETIVSSVGAGHVDVPRRPVVGDALAQVDIGERDRSVPVEAIVKERQSKSEAKFDVHRPRIRPGSLNLRVRHF